MNQEAALQEIPIESDRFAWPEASLDPVSKMRAVAAGLPHCALGETVLNAPFERVWSFISDLEGNTAHYEGTVTRVRILERSGESLRIESRMLSGFWMESQVVLRPGWCLMHSRLGQVGMAARPEGDARTRFIHFERSKRLAPLLRPFFAWNIRGDFRRLAALLE